MLRFISTPLSASTGLVMSLPSALQDLPSRRTLCDLGLPLTFRVIRQCVLLFFFKFIYREMFIWIELTLVTQVLETLGLRLEPCHR
jgi:hypothetical protein